MSDGRIIVVSGGSRGIGATTCRRLIEQGYCVIALSRGAPSFEGVIHEYCDLSDVSTRQDIFHSVAKRYDVYGLVNNAGIATPNNISEFDKKVYQDVLDLNATAVAELSAALVPSMMRRNEGRIINISSELILGFASRTAYSASKAAVASFAKTWALELGQYNICCNAIAPGPVETELFKSNNPLGSDIRKRKLAKIPLGRFGSTSDIAGVVNFLMSREAGFITGQTIYVCGGSSLGSVPF